MAQRYRDLQRPSILDTGIVQPNAGDVAARLADTFKTFESMAWERQGLLRAQQGEEEGAIAGEEMRAAANWAQRDRELQEGLAKKGVTEGRMNLSRASSSVPTLRTGLRATTAYGRAYNNAAIRSYAIQAEADADETAARLEAEAGSDPERFRTVFGKVRDDILQNAEPGMRAALSEIYGRRLGAGVVRATEKRALEVKNEHRVIAKQGLQQMVDRAGRLRAEGDDAGADEEMLKMEALLGSVQNDGTYTPAEVQAMRREAQVGVLAQEEAGSFVRELQNPEGDPLAYIERLRAEYATTEALSADEENRVIDGLFAEWRQYASLQASRHSQEVDGHVATVLDAYSRGQTAGTAALSSLTGVPESLKDSVRGKVLEALNERRALAREENVATLVSIARAEAKNSVDGQTYANVERMYDAGAYTPEQYANQLAALDSSRLRKAGDVAVMKEVHDSLASGVPLDPSNPEIRKALAAAFDVQTQGLEEGSPEWRTTAMAFASRTRMLPTQAISWAEKMRRSPNPAQVIPAAQFLSLLHETAPQALEGVDERSLAFSSLVADSASAGTDPKEAVDLARKIVYETPKEVTEQLKARYRVDKYDDTSNAALDTYLNRDFDPGIRTAQPRAPLELQATFNAQTRRYFDITRGDISKARDLAWRDLKRVSGVTEVNGVREYMLMPPENFGVSAEAVRKDLASRDLPGVDTSKLLLVPDSATQQQAVNMMNGASTPPSYKIYTDKGEPLYVNGKPQRYYLPDSGKLVEQFNNAKKQAELKEQENLDRLRRHRDAERMDKERRQLTLTPYWEQ